LPTGVVRLCSHACRRRQTAASAARDDVMIRSTSPVQRNLIANQAEARPIAGHDSKAVQYFLCSCVFELTWQDYLLACCATCQPPNQHTAVAENLSLDQRFVRSPERPSGFLPFQ
jgi:hypothetical protein